MLVGTLGKSAMIPALTLDSCPLTYWSTKDPDLSPCLGASKGILYEEIGLSIDDLHSGQAKTVANNDQCFM